MGPSRDPALALPTESPVLVFPPAGVHAESVAASAAADNKDHPVTVFTVTLLRR
jgi:hypothetical protein